MLQVDGVAQRNASSAEELSATAQEMLAQSETLRRRLDQFVRVEDAAVERPERPPRPVLERSAERPRKPARAPVLATAPLAASEETGPEASFRRY